MWRSRSRMSAVCSRFPPAGACAWAQERLYGSDTHSVLIVLQASDAAGKDGTIKHVMSGVNPQGCQICAFKKRGAKSSLERHLTRHGTTVLKFFRNVSNEARRQRFLERLERRERTWKFSFGDLEERKHWAEYRQPFEQMVQNTITKRDRGGSSPPTTSG